MEDDRYVRYSGWADHQPSIKPCFIGFSRKVACPKRASGQVPGQVREKTQSTAFLRGSARASKTPLPSCFYWRPLRPSPLEEGGMVCSGRAALRFRKSHASRTNRRPKQAHTMAPITRAGIIKPDSAVPTAPRPPHAMVTKRKIIPQGQAFLRAWRNSARTLSRSDGMAGFPWRIITRVGKP